MNLKGKKVIVSGVCGGFGKVLCRELKAQGALIGGIDVNSAALEESQTDCDVLKFAACDLTDAEQTQVAFEQLYDELEGVDALVNLAGILYNEPLLKLVPGAIQRHGLESWKKVLDINLTATFHLSALVAEKMFMHRTKGVIVNISSVAAKGNAGQCAYASSKAAVETLSKTMALELSPIGIRVCCVAPGYSQTDSTHQVMNADTLDEIVSEIPLKRLGCVEEIVDGIVFCLKNDFFNGKTLELDGGHVL